MSERPRRQPGGEQCLREGATACPSQQPQQHPAAAVNGRPQAPPQQQAAQQDALATGRTDAAGVPAAPVNGGAMLACSKTNPRF